MNAQERRNQILTILEKHPSAITANELAQRFQVSRQVIVGDIAILRAQNYEILATNQGYLIPSLEIADTAACYTGVLVCRHDLSQMEAEITTILEWGGRVLDVQIDHPVYGLLSASLHINEKKDLEAFVDRMKTYEGEMLASLTNGIHSHTIQTANQTQFEKIKDQLNQLHILYN